MQKMNGNNKTFAQLPESVMSQVLHEGSQSHRIDVVFNVCRDTSIKNAERCNRISSTAIQYQNTSGGPNIQQWRKFLRSSCNKSSLIKFIFEQWKLPKYREKPHDKSLCVTCEEVCYKMTKDDWVEVTELRSTQEEADTRVLMHALHAAKAGSKAVIVTAEDTDVMVLCLRFKFQQRHPLLHL